MQSTRVEAGVTYDLTGLTETELETILAALDFPDWSETGEGGERARTMYRQLTQETGVWKAAGEVFSSNTSSF